MNRVRRSLAPGGRASRLLLQALAMALALVPSAPRAAAALAVRWDGPLPAVRLVAPSPGAVLTGGQMAEIAWEPAGPLDAGIEEWEAFLSLDDGATYPVRITPHLDIGLRRAAFQVPALPCRAARLLLRFGDERREASLPLAPRFAIAPAAAGRFAPPPAQALGAGEPALPGAAGVVAWTEGSRHGGALRQVAGTPAAGLRRRCAAVEIHSEPALDAPAPDDPLLETAPGPPHTGPARHAPSRVCGPAAVRPAGSDLLLLLKRRNE